ncbi:MAG TPA: hypothetical protein VHY37_02745 [Tepidisphaeraceae bacterium]|jgi:hypothetical protein|nr:hypothetical protein [Tepidisphaeraceae bacterium]
MVRQVAYGLAIDSEIPLPELPPSATPAADIVIRRGAIDGARPAEAMGNEWAWVTPTKAFLRYDGVVAFLIRQGNEIIVDSVPGADAAQQRLFLLGPALGMLLHQRGKLVLHASAIAVGGAAVAFLADKGLGKSTIAAAFCAAGHGLIVDDILAIDIAAHTKPMAIPGFPQLKLWPESAARFVTDAESLPRLAPDIDKRSRLAPAGFPDRNLALRCIYILTDGDREGIEPLGPQQTFAELIRHSYLAQAIAASGMSQAHFRQIVALAESTPIARLQRRRSLDVLPDVVRLVEQHCAQLNR